MNCDCKETGENQGWITWSNAQPVNPQDLISNALINSTQGKYENSSDFLASSWGTSPLSITANPTCVALGTDSAQKEADAAQWNFSHSSANLASTTAPPLRKVLFLRVGEQWQTDIPMSTSAIIADLQISCLNNAGTRGDTQGTVPTIAWRAINIAVGTFTLSMTMRVAGKYSIGIWAKTNTGTFSLTEYTLNVLSEPAPASPTPAQLSLSPLKVTSLVPRQDSFQGVVGPHGTLQHSGICICGSENTKCNDDPTDTAPLLACTIGTGIILACNS